MNAPEPNADRLLEGLSEHEADAVRELTEASAALSPGLPAARRGGRLVWALYGLAFLLLLGAVFFDGLLLVVLSKEQQVLSTWARVHEVRRHTGASLPLGHKDPLKTLDPWGNPYVQLRALVEFQGQLCKGWKIYSVGPNGRDESAAGDDIVVDVLSWLALAYFSELGPAVFALLALLLVCLAHVVQLLRTPVSHVRGVETLQIWALLALPILFGLAALLLFGDDLMESLPGSFVLPPGLVLWGTALVGLALLFVAVRFLRRAWWERTLEGDDPA